MEAQQAHAVPFQTQILPCNMFTQLAVVQQDTNYYKGH